MQTKVPTYSTLKVTDKHLGVIKNALEVYYRLRSGQIKMALDCAYGYGVVDWDCAQQVEQIIQRYYMKDLPRGCSYSFCSPEIGSARIAYEIEKTIQEYLSVKDNDGFYGWGCNFDSPLKASDEALPYIEEHKNYKNYYLSPKDSKEIQRLADNAEFDEMWKLIRQKISLPRAEKLEVITDSDRVYVKATKPQKNQS